MPAGSPLTDRLTSARKLPVTLTVTPIDVVVFWISLIDPAPRLTARPEGCVMVKVRETDLVTAPPLAETWMEYVPAGACGLMLKESVLPPEPGALNEAGVKLAVAPAGTPAAASWTAELKPPETPTVTLMLVFAPCATAMEEDERLTCKPGAAGAGGAVASVQ